MDNLTDLIVILGILSIYMVAGCVASWLIVKLLERTKWLNWLLGDKDE